MDYFTLHKECKEILNRILSAEEKRFEICTQCQRLVHKCSVFTSPLHHMQDSEDNLVILQMLKGTLVATEEFIDEYYAYSSSVTPPRSPATPLTTRMTSFNENAISDEEKLGIDVKYTNLCIRIANMVHSMQLSNHPTTTQDLLVEECLEIVNNITHVNEDRYVFPPDCRKFILSCRIFSDILHCLNDSLGTIPALTKLKATLHEVMGFIVKYACNSILAETFFITNRSSYNKSVDRLLLQIAHDTHKLEQFIPLDAKRMLPEIAHTVGFTKVHNECKEMLGHIINTNEMRFVNPADCRHLIRTCRSLHDPLNNVIESDMSLIALEELRNSLGSTHKFLDTYANSSVFGETVYHTSRSTYDKAWEDIMLLLGHDLHVLQRICTEQTITAQFYAEVRSCQALLSEIIDASEATSVVNALDCQMLVQRCMSFVTPLHELQQSEANIAGVANLKAILKEVNEFMALFSSRNSVGEAVYATNHEGYTHELSVISAKLGEASQQFNAALSQTNMEAVSSSRVWSTRHASYRGSSARDMHVDDPGALRHTRSQSPPLPEISRK